MPTGRVNWDYFKVPIYIAILALGEWYAYRMVDDFFTCLYTFTFLTALTVRFFGWPKPSWMATAHVDHEGRKWGNLPLAELFEQEPLVKHLRREHGAEEYFTALTYDNLSQKLCNEINSNLTLKIIVYAFLLVAYMLLAKKVPHEQTSEAVDIFKNWAGAFLSFSLFLWDVAQFEKQRHWNHDIRVLTDDG